MRSYEDLREYLRTWTTPHNDPGYDTNGLLHLLLACVDNLRENAVPEELMEIAPLAMTREQADLLRNLADWQASDPDVSLRGSQE